MGWLKRAQGAGAGLPSNVVTAVGEVVRDPFTVGEGEGYVHGGSGGLAGSGGDLVRLGARLPCPSSPVRPGASSTPAGRQSERNRPDGLSSTAPSRARFCNKMPRFRAWGV